MPSLALMLVAAEHSSPQLGLAALPVLCNVPVCFLVAAF